jgi:sulfoxide reductase heme-binding subunit YedZ
VTLAVTTGPTAMWYLTRATGVVALLLVTASVLLGILSPLRAQSSRWPRFALGTLHRDISLMVVLLVVVHVVTTVLDGFAPVSLLDAIIPFVSAYRPLWLGLGALAFDLILVLVATSLLRRRLGHRAWRAIHWFAYASWPVAVLHSLGTGTDAAASWLLALTAACVAAVLLAVIARLRDAGAHLPGSRGAWYGLAGAVCAGLVAFTALGPLQAGWARRAGTPANLLSHRVALRPVVPVRAVVTTRPDSSLPPPAAPRAPFTAALSGSLTQTQLGAGSVADLELTLSGGLSGRLRIRLGGQAQPSGGLSLSGSQVDLAARGYAEVLKGRVSMLAGPDLVARVSDAAGARYELKVSLQIDGNDVSGSLQGSSL